MEELLYSIEIYKKDIEYSGKLFSTNNEIKEFHSKNLDGLLRDIVADIELDHEVSSNGSNDYFEDSE